jgi:hypothetical protein
MSRLLSELGHAIMVVSAFRQWIANHSLQVASIADLFDGTIRQLLTLKEIWPLLVTDWLLSENLKHVAVLEQILANNRFDEQVAKELKFDKGHLDELLADDLLFLIKRMLGYVHDRAQVTSLALSMLQSNDKEKRIYPLLSEMLVNEVGYDYSKSTINTLCNAANETLSEADRNFLRTTAEAINKKIEPQRSLPAINELRPSTKLLRLFSLARNKQFAYSYKYGNKNSLLKLIATNVPIKAGMGCISPLDPSYQLTKLSSMTLSVELPGRMVSDPIGYCIRLHKLRLAKRGDTCD